MLDLAPHNANGLRLRSPLMIASGCLNLGSSEHVRLTALEAVGAVVSPTVTLNGRRSERRLVETSGGFLLGAWPEYSLTSVLSERLDSWNTAATPLLISLRAEHAPDYSRLAQALDERSDLVSGFEICLTEHGPAIDQILAALRAVTLLPVLVKLPYQPTLLVELARAAADAGADALVVAAPPQAMHLDPLSATLWQGQLCGAAIFPLMLRMVAEVAAALPIPVVASGGISSLPQAQAALQAGAQALQIGSALLSEPGLPARLGEALKV